jgi:hypothetical protein
VQLVSLVPAEDLNRGVGQVFQRLVRAEVPQRSPAQLPDLGDPPAARVDEEARVR